MNKFEPFKLRIQNKDKLIKKIGGVEKDTIKIYNQVISGMIHNENKCNNK